AGSSRSVGRKSCEARAITVASAGYSLIGISEASATLNPVTRRLFQRDQRCLRHGHVACDVAQKLARLTRATAKPGYAGPLPPGSAKPPPELRRSASLFRGRAADAPARDTSFRG